MSPMQMTKEGIPVIDISVWLSSTASENDRNMLMSDLRHACSTYGFFQLVGHGIPVEMMDRILKCGKTFFDLSTNEKMEVVMKNSMGRAHRGYEILRSQTTQKGALPDLKEGFVIGPEMSADDPMAGKLLRGPNLWPSSIAAKDFKEPMQEYHNRMTQLAEILLEMLRVALPVPVSRDLFDEFTRQPSANIRLLHYPPQTSKDERQFGVGAHTDVGAITLNLQQCGTSGLEVWYPPTSVWIPVKPERGAFVVNIGNMLQMWTCGYYRSALHRVVNATKDHRYSVPFLYNGNMESYIAPIAALQAHTTMVVANELQVVCVERHFDEWLTKTRT